MTIPPITSEQTITNLVLNPSAAVNASGWNAVSGSVARTTDWAYQGPASAQLTATGANAQAYVFANIPATPHTMWAIVRNTAASPRSVRLVYPAGSATGDAVVVPAGEVAMTAPLTVIGVASNQSVRVRWDDSVNGEVFNVGHFQISPGSSAAPICPLMNPDGTLTDGSTWTGTEHLSASERVITRRTPGFFRLGSTYIGPMRVERG